MNLTDTFLSGMIAKSKDVSAAALRQAELCLLDYRGVVAGGAKVLAQTHPGWFEHLIRENGPCSVWGVNYKTSPLNAAFLNGFSAHVLELDDGHRLGMIHLGASIISAVLATAEVKKLQQESIHQGIVMGYEAAVRCARALQPSHKLKGYHVSGTCGTIGSAIGCAFACGYSAEQLKSTLACAVTSAAGLLEIQEDASQLKPYNLGRAAMDGVAAAQMGKLALPGPDDVLGGKRGLLAVMTSTPSMEALVDFSKTDFCIEGVYRKLYSACRHCHPAIEAALILRDERQLRPETVLSVQVQTYHLAIEGHDHTEIYGVSSAKLSTPFSVALALVRGHAGFSDFSEENVQDPEILSLARKVVVNEDPTLTALSPGIRAARVRIVTQDGVWEKQVDYPKGEPENPLSPADHRNKMDELSR